VNKRLTEPSGQPPWLRVLISLGGLAVVGHETAIHDGEVRWPLLLAALVMMGLANSTILDRYLPSSPRAKEDQP
jgi:hypothetical protein